MEGIGGFIEGAKILAARIAPGWRLCNGRGRCDECGEMADPVWRYFANQSTYTNCLCEPCVDKEVS